LRISGLLCSISSSTDFPESFGVEYARYIDQNIHSVLQETMFGGAVKSVGERLSLFPIEANVSFKAKFNDQAFSDLLRDEPLSNISDLKSTLQAKILQKRTYLATQIYEAMDHKSIFDILDHNNLHKITTRLRYLHEITPDDDPEDHAMEFKSLKELATFFIGDGFHYLIHKSE